MEGMLRNNSLYIASFLFFYSKVYSENVKGDILL